MENAFAIQVAPTGINHIYNILIYASVLFPSDHRYVLPTYCIELPPFFSTGVIETIRMRVVSPAY